MLRMKKNDIWEKVSCGDDADEKIKMCLDWYKIPYEIHDEIELSTVIKVTPNATYRKERKALRGK